MAKMINLADAVAQYGGSERMAELFISILETDPSLGATCTIKTSQRDKGKIITLSSGTHVGTKGKGCNPTYQQIAPAAETATWDLQDYEIPLSICSEDWKSIMQEFNQWRDNGDDKMERLITSAIRPLIEDEITQTLQRYGWFGDLNADTFTNGGNFSDTIDGAAWPLDWVNVCDGLFTKLAAIVALAPNQLTAIAANAQTSYATQQSAIAVAGVATGILDAVLRDANPRIKNNGGVLLMTDAFYQAFYNDYNANHNATIPYETVAEGVGLSMYRGVKIIVVSWWDSIINEFQNTGTAWYKPFRVVYANLDNLLIGTSSNRDNLELEFNFDAKSRENLIYASSNIDTAIPRSKEVHVAM